MHLSLDEMRFSTSFCLMRFCTDLHLKQICTVCQIICTIVVLFIVRDGAIQNYCVACKNMERLSNEMPCSTTSCQIRYGAELTAARQGTVNKKSTFCWTLSTAT
jgi:hypothetical protein